MLTVLTLLAIAALPAVLVLALLHSLWLHFFKRIAPGPFPVPLLGCVGFVRATRRAATIVQLSRTYSADGTRNVQVFTPFGGSVLLVANAEDIHHIAVTNAANYWRKAPFTSAAAVRELGEDAGRGILLNDDAASWRLNRTMLLKGLHAGGGQFMRSTVVTACHVHTHSLVQQWEQRCVVHGQFFVVDDVADAMRSLTLALVLRTAFGMAVDTADEARLSQLRRLIGEAMAAFFFFMATPPCYWRVFARGKAEHFRRARRELHDFAARLVREIREHGVASDATSAPPCYVQLLLAASSSADATAVDSDDNNNDNTEWAAGARATHDGGASGGSHGDDSRARLDDEQVARLAANVLIGGTDTTASTLVFALLFLAEHPHIQQALFTECSRVVEASSSSSSSLPRFDSDSVQRLQLLDRVVRETLRLRPSVPAMPRVCSHADQLPSGVRLAAHSHLMVCATAQHVSSRNFADPLHFNPDANWAAAAVAGARHERVAWLPFGAGVKACPGKQLALLELKLVLAQLVCAFRFHLVGTRAGDIPLSGLLPGVRVPLRVEMRG